MHTTLRKIDAITIAVVFWMFIFEVSRIEGCWLSTLNPQLSTLLKRRPLHKRVPYIMKPHITDRSLTAGDLRACRYTRPKLAARCFALGWIDRIRDSRAVAITPRGQIALRELFRIDAERLRPAA